MSQAELLTVLGPLAPLFTDAEIQEIMVDAPDKVYVERQGKLVDTAVTFTNEHALRQTIDQLLAIGGISLTAHDTTAEARLPDGSRFVAVLPPTAVSGPALVIRKMIDNARVTWENLIKWGSITPEAIDLYRSAIAAQASILVVGGTASGKTTLANRIVELIPPDERIVIVESTHEMQVNHPRRVYLEAGGPANVAIDNLLATAARMRPSWLVTGETSGAEAMQIVSILSQGYTGLVNIHGISVEDGLARLETLCLMTNLGLGLLEIRAIIAAALRLITYQERLRNGRRKVLQISELCGVENGRYALQPLFRYNQEIETLEPTGIQPTWAKPSA